MHLPESVFIDQAYKGKQMKILVCSDSVSPFLDHLDSPYRYYTELAAGFSTNITHCQVIPTI